MRKGEKGQALAIVLVLLAFGALAIAPFLSHASSSLMGSRVYGAALTGQYAGDAGVEHAIWGLRYGDLTDQLPEVGDSLEYPLDEAVNGVSPVEVTVLKMDTATYEITSAAGDQTIQAVVSLAGAAVIIRQWQIS